jgi:hypothetical protein
MNSLESLAIFLCICGQNRSNTSVQNTFKHSDETISRKIDGVLRCLIKMAKDYIRSEDRNFTTVHKRIRGDQRMWPHLKGCIGAIDDIHIDAILIPRDYVRYISRSDTKTQNVMDMVDFDMPFTYVSIGQPGSMHDTGVLFHALNMILLPFHILLMIYISFGYICCIQSHLCSYIFHIYLSRKILYG